MENGACVSQSRLDFALHAMRPPACLYCRVVRWVIASPPRSRHCNDTTLTRSGCITMPAFLFFLIFFPCRSSRPAPCPARTLPPRNERSHCLGDSSSDVADVADLAGPVRQVPWRRRLEKRFRQSGSQFRTAWRGGGARGRSGRSSGWPRHPLWTGRWSGCPRPRDEHRARTRGPGRGQGVRRRGRGRGGRRTTGWRGAVERTGVPTRCGRTSRGPSSPSDSRTSSDVVVAGHLGCLCTPWRRDL